MILLFYFHCLSEISEGSKWVIFRFIFDQFYNSLPIVKHLSILSLYAFKLAAVNTLTEDLDDYYGQIESKCDQNKAYQLPAAQVTCICVRDEVGEHDKTVTADQGHCFVEELQIVLR